MSRVRTASFLLKHGWDGETTATTTLGGLRHVSDERTRRHPARRLAGALPIRARRTAGTVSAPAELARIKSLVIPPAWTDVWICPDPRGHLQATGRDARGRKQYRYHPRLRQMRDEVKYGRLPAFAQALRRIRRRTAADVRKRGLPREKVLAAAVQLLEKTLIRIGNEEYARANGSVGLTTMRDRHATVRGADGPLRVPRQERRRARGRSPRRAPGAHRQGLPRSARLRAVPVRRRRRRAADDRLRRRERVPARDQRRRFHRQGLPHLGRHRAGGAGAGAARHGSSRRREAKRNVVQAIACGRQAARQHQGGLPEVLHPSGDPRRLHGRRRPMADRRGGRAPR